MGSPMKQQPNHGCTAAAAAQQPHKHTDGIIGREAPPWADADEIWAAIPETGDFDMALLDALSERFRHCRREQGAYRACNAWMDAPLDAWLNCLNKGSSELGRSSMVAFVVGMHEELSIRDALIVSLIIDERRCSKRQLMAFAAKPHLPDSKRRMNELLSAAFTDEGLAPDRDRCSVGMSMLLAMAAAVPVPYCVQPLAIVAYTMWWMGDERAEEYALWCLALDDRCSLASIVYSAVGHGIAPAWRLR